MLKENREIKKRNRYNTETFIEKARSLEHCANYDFKKSVYKAYNKKLVVTCHVKDENGNEHGDFLITPGHLFEGQGCPVCRYIKSAKSKRRTFDELVNDAKKVHGDKYDYSLITDYKNDRIKYPIICPEHGIFYQTMNNHITGKQGCPTCGRNLADEKRRLTTEEFVEKARKVHGNKYDYSKVNYVASDEKVCIICPEHGEFWQTPSNHLMGQRCPQCGNISRGILKRLTTEEFVEKARKVHGNKYDYSKVNYVTSDEKVCIICPEHGEFWQSTGNHLQGNGCPKCVPLYSKPENKALQFVYDVLGKENVETRNRIILRGKELDIYIPSKRIAIEFDGIFWHNELTKDKYFHINKTIECEKNNIHLFHIFEDEWKYKQDIIKSMLLNIFDKTPNKIMARKCEIREVSTHEASTFLDNNHLQGKCGSSVKLGLYYNDELVSLMTFGKSRHFVGNGKHQWELLRFCNKLNTNVIGGASKLLKHFIKLYNPEEIVSYADRRWSTGNLYNVLGFKLYNKSQPNYYYVIGDKRYYRFNFRKSILVKKYGCPENMSEHEFCLSQHWYRIYDCGCLCYIWKKENENKN